MLKNLKTKVTKKEKQLLGGFFYGITFKNGYFFPLSGRFIPIKKNKRNKNAWKIKKTSFRKIFG